MPSTPVSSCACCTPAADRPSVRSRFIAGAEQWGMTGPELVGLIEVFDAGHCAGTRAEAARLVRHRLAVAQNVVLDLVDRATTVQACNSSERPSMPTEVAEIHHDTVTALASVARLQAADAWLAEPSAAGACTEECPCVRAATSATAPDGAGPRMQLAPSSADAENLVCTLDGGLDAMRGRIGEWQAVIKQATRRLPAENGVTLLYDHDPALTVELARLAAAEFACCSFFVFTLAVSPEGVRFTVTAPPEASGVVMAVFGSATPA